MARHHFTHRGKTYQVVPKDGKEVFNWWRAHNVVIGDDVWIGPRAVMLRGVPEKVTRYRVPEEIRQRPLELA